MRIDIFHHHSFDDWAASRLDRIFALLEELMASQADIKIKLDAIVADVAEERTQIGGIETLLDNLAAIIKKLQDDATSANVDPAIVAQIDVLASAVGGNKQRIIDDIKKNTPPTP